MKKIVTICVCFVLSCTTASAQLKPITNEMIKTKTKAVIAVMEKRIPVTVNPSGIRERYYRDTNPELFYMHPDISIIYIDGRMDVRMTMAKSLLDVGANGLGESYPKKIADSLISIEAKLLYDHGADYVYIGMEIKETPFEDRSFYYSVLCHFEEVLKKL